MSESGTSPPSPGAARAVLAALGDGPAKALLVAGIGGGKSTALESVRRSLRAAGRRVAGRVPGSDEPLDAVVVDDAHLLTGAELERLTALAQRPETTVIAAAESREHQPGLRELAAALEREGSRIVVGALTGGEVSRLIADPAGHPPAPELLRTAMTATAGIPLLVAAVAAAPRPLSAETIDRAAFLAMVERLRRLGQSDLEALLIASLSTDLGATDLSAALELPSGVGHDLIDRIRGTGLVAPSHPPEFLRTVHRAAAQVVGAGRHHEIETALLRTQLELSTLSDTLALELAEHGMRDAALARELTRRAAASPRGAEEQARIIRAAVDAGAGELRGELADVLARCGECSAATALADAALGSTDPAERALAVRVAASVAVHDGNTAQAAELMSWLGPCPDATVGAAAAIVHLGSGDAGAARAALAVGHRGPPTAPARTARNLAQGLLATVEVGYPAATARLGQAIGGESTGVAMPDSAPALVALAALHSGDSVRAASVIGRAVRAGGDPAFALRHRLLQGWVRMQDGRLIAAAGALESTGGAVLHGRDALWAAALGTAIARRGGDAGALHRHWYAGVEVLAEYSIDLFSLLPLAELWLAAARLRQQDRLATAVQQAFALLTALSEPTAWSLPLHWAGVQAAIGANDPAGVAPHGQALAVAAADSPFAAALATAGRTWLQVLAGRVDPAEVTAAARGLARFGLTSDATRLAGQAALQAPDPKVSGLMLQVARDLKVGTGEDAADPSDSGPGRPARPVSTTLSDREREVAELLLLGMPYRDIGAQLYISAKTVEHHVARIRRRLGAESRSEMLSMLRATLTAEGT